jgi:hypothetical protein
VYDKYCTVLDVFEKPDLYQNPTAHITFDVVIVLIGYRSFVGIWITRGVYAAGSLGTKR